MVVAGNVLLVAALLYAAVGIAVGLRFAIIEATAFSERAAVGSFPFRLLLVPGAALLWPLVLRAGAKGVVGRPIYGEEWAAACREQDNSGAAQRSLPLPDRREEKRW